MFGDEDTNPVDCYTERFNYTYKVLLNPLLIVKRGQWYNTSFEPCETIVPLSTTLTSNHWLWLYTPPLLQFRQETDLFYFLHFADLYLVFLCFCLYAGVKLRPQQVCRYRGRHHATQDPHTKPAQTAAGGRLAGTSSHTDSSSTSSSGRSRSSTVSIETVWSTFVLRRKFSEGTFQLLMLVYNLLLSLSVTGARAESWDESGSVWNATAGHPFP